MNPPFAQVCLSSIVGGLSQFNSRALCRAVTRCRQELLPLCIHLREGLNSGRITSMRLLQLLAAVG